MVFSSMARASAAGERSVRTESGIGGLLALEESAADAGPFDAAGGVAQELGVGALHGAVEADEAVGGDEGVMGGRLGRRRGRVFVGEAVLGDVGEAEAVALDGDLDF